MHITGRAQQDRLTKRERFLYRAVHGSALLLCACGFAWYLIFKVSSPSFVEAVLFALVAVTGAVFGYALRGDIRVIHGIHWLREEPKE